MFSESQVRDHGLWCQVHTPAGSMGNSDIGDWYYPPGATPNGFTQATTSSLPYQSPMSLFPILPAGVWTWHHSPWSLTCDSLNITHQSTPLPPMTPLSSEITHKNLETKSYQLHSRPGWPRLATGMLLLRLPLPLIKLLPAGGVQPPTCAEQYLPHRASSSSTTAASTFLLEYILDKRTVLHQSDCRSVNTQLSQLCCTCRSWVSVSTPHAKDRLPPQCGRGS